MMTEIDPEMMVKKDVLLWIEGFFQKKLVKNGQLFDHPASKASREVANFIERKNPHTPVYGVKEFVCLSVINFDPNYLRIG